MVFRLGKPRRRHELAEMLEDDMVGLLEPGVEMEGKMKVACGMIRLNSHFKGEIDCAGAVVIADQGEIEGQIRGKLISITGKVKGNVHAAERLEIKEHGVVLGDICTPCLVVDPGGYFDGQCNMPSPEPERSTTPDVEPKDRP